MGECLIVANQTLGGAELERAVRDRMAAGRQTFYVVVPIVDPQAEAAAWVPPDPAFGIPSQVSGADETRERARQRSEHRLGQMLEKIRQAGGAVDGELGPTDPVKAVEGVLERHTVDEVIVSTLPAGLSRWLKLDLPSRIARAVDVPVVTIEAKAQS